MNLKPLITTRLRRTAWLLGRVTLIAIAAGLSVSAAPNADGISKVPPMEFIQARLWKNMRLQDFRLEGIVRTSKAKYPIILRTRGHEMVYEFQDQPLQIRVVMNSEQAVIQKRANSKQKWRTLSGEERKSLVLDSDIAYEDLGLDFMRWENVEVLGTDSIVTLPAWAFEAKPPRGESRYAKARFWISSRHYAFLRVDAYNTRGEVVRRVEVNGVQKIGEAYVIKEMQVSSMIPGRELSRSRTYVEIREGKPGSSGLG